MKKLIWVALAFSLMATAALRAEPAKYVDGNWFQLAGFNSHNESKYGAPGDTTITEVLAQVDAYQKAKAKAEADASDIASRELCEELAVRSAVRGQYALEVGRLYMKAGDTVKAKAAWERALAWGQAAEKATYNTDSAEENEKVANNQKTGTWVVTVATRWLKKIK